MDETRSILLIDLDGVARSVPANVFSDFVADSRRWLNRLTPSRRWILRRAFVDSRSEMDLSTMRAAGIDVVACPPLTRTGKTGSDIFLNVAALEAVADGRIDEAVVAVGRTDIAPLLHELRRRGVTTTVIGTKAVIAAFEGMCDAVVRIDRLDDAGPAEA